MISLAASGSVAEIAGSSIPAVRAYQQFVRSDPGIPPELRVPVSEFAGMEVAHCLQVIAWTAAGTVLAAMLARRALGWLLLTCGLMQSGLDLLVTLWLQIEPTQPSFVLWVFGLVLTFGAPAVVFAWYPVRPFRARRWAVAAAAASAGIALQAALMLAAAAAGLNVWECLQSTADICASAPLLAAIFVAGLSRWRRQARSWLLGCGLLAYAGLFIGAWIWDRDEPIPGRRLPLQLLSPWMLIPVAVVVGVLSHRQFKMRAVMRRSIVYAVLMIAVFIVYLGVTAMVGTALRGAPVPGAVTAAVVAVCFAPAWNRLQRMTDNLVYGWRQDPLRVMAELNDRFAADDHLDLLPAAVATVAAAVRADGATIVRPDGTILAIAGEDPPRYLALPLRFGGADIGELRVSRPHGEEYSAADLRFVSALSAQLAVVLSATDLNEALEAERNRVVAATGDERDRLRRDLHDRLGPSLAGMALGLQALSGLIGGPKEPAMAVVERLRSEAGTAVEDIRRIIDGLRPTVLDTANLTQAVLRHADGLNAALPVDVTADRLPVLAPEIEAAAYCIITEALTNVARHAQAHHAEVTISAGEALHIAVRDDGHGMRADGRTPGVGLKSMRRRAEALGGGLAVDSTGGGTTITATLPLRSS